MVLSPIHVVMHVDRAISVYFAIPKTPPARVQKRQRRFMLCLRAVELESVHNGAA